MRRNLGRAGISGVLITTCMWPFGICIQKILDLGQEVFIIRVTCINRKKGLCMYPYRCMYVYTIPFLRVSAACPSVRPGLRRGARSLRAQGRLARWREKSAEEPIEEVEAWELSSCGPLYGSFQQ